MYDENIAVQQGTRNYKNLEKAEKKQGAAQLPTKGWTNAVQGRKIY